MKKSFLMFLVMTVLTYSLYLEASATYRYQYDQESIKRSSALKNGKSFIAFEREMRDKYANLPSILLADELSLCNIVYVPSLHAILIDKNRLNTLEANEIMWLILHESGHAQRPEMIPSIQRGVIATRGLSLYFWGMHKKKPYRNILTKAGSKIAAMYLIGNVVEKILMQHEERRADVCANRIADADTLRGGLAYLTKEKQRYKNDFERVTGMSASNVVIAEGVDPFHPSPDERIHNIQQALKDRFNIDA